MKSNASNPTDGRIKSTDRRNLMTISAFAAFWNAISWTAVYLALPKFIQKHSPAKWMILIFPAVGVGLFGVAVYSWLKWLKFGNAIFEMASVPGAVGGAVEGTIKVGRFLRFPEGVTVRLCCVRRITTGSGKNSSTQETLLWESERRIPDAGGADSIPVLFAIPADAPETDTTNSVNQVLWQLSAKAKLPGINLSETFDVPVFKVAQTPAQVAVVQRARAAEATELAHYERPATSRIRVQPVSDGTEFYFPAARNPGVAAGLTVVTLIISGVIFALVHSKAPIVFLIGAGLVVACLLIALTNLWLGTTRVIVAKTGLTITKRLAGIPRYRIITGAEIVAITVKPGMTAGTTVYHDIKIGRKSGNEITAGGSIRDYEEAQWLAREMARCAAISNQS